MRITREEIIKKLELWYHNEISAQEIKSWADNFQENKMYSESDFEGNEDNRNSVIKEIIIALSNLDINLVITDDIPIYIQFLKTPIGQFQQGYLRWDTALETIDYEKRKRSLKSDPFYSRFC